MAGERHSEISDGRLDRGDNLICLVQDCCDYCLNHVSRRRNLDGYGYGICRLREGNAKERDGKNGCGTLQHMEELYYGMIL